MPNYNFPVFHTQGGGLVRQTAGDGYTFVEAPDRCLNLDVGDPMPAEWGLAPANQAASDLMEQAQHHDW